MSRAGAVRLAGSFSRDPAHLSSETHQISTLIWDYMEKSQPGLPRSRHDDAGSPANLAEIFSCNRFHLDNSRLARG